MTAALNRRIAALESALPDGTQPALVIVYADYIDREALSGVDGICLLRLADETVVDFLARLEAHVRAERGRALPFVGFANYGPDDAPDAPPEPDTTALS